MSTRARAVLCCMWFGLVPWPTYESTKHYRGAYLGHVVLNLRYAVDWMRGRESAADVLFEWRVNSRPRWTRWHR